MKKENNRYLSTIFTCIALLLSIGCCLLCGGCSNEAGLPEEPGSVPLRVESLRLDAGVTTRTGGTPVTNEGATIGVFLTNAGGYAPVFNNTYTYASGAWGSTDPVYVDSRQGKAVAVYDPNHVVTFAAGSTVTSEPLQAQAYDGNKLWWYDNTSGASVTSASPPVAFSMKCAYARLKFSIKRTANYNQECKVSRIVMQPTAGEFYTKSPVDIVTGTLQMAGATPATSLIIDSSILPVNTVGIAPNVINTDIDWLFPAQQLTSGAGLTFRLTIDGVARSITVPASLINNGKLEAGHQYTINLKITDTGVILDGNIEIADMVTGDNLQNDKPEVLAGIQVPANLINLGGSACTDQDKRDLSKLRWAEGNLINDTINDSKPYDWAPTQSDYGYYYLWNSTYVKTDNWDANGIDPCTRLNAIIYGEGWRTPSKNELLKLTRCTDNERKMYNNVRGIWYMADSIGVFLPLAAYSTTGSSGVPTQEGAVDAGEFSFYWSTDVAAPPVPPSTQYPDGLPAKAWVLTWNYGSPEQRVNPLWENYAIPVRCVKGARQ